MEYLLTCQPLFHASKEKLYKTKNRVLFKFQILEGKNGPNHLRKNYFINLESLNKKFSSTSKNLAPGKAKQFFPQINTVSNYISSNINKDKKEENLYYNNISMKIHKKYKSKDEAIKSIIMPYKKNNSFKYDDEFIINNAPLTELHSPKKKSLKKKENTFFKEIIGKKEKNDLKYIKLSKINKNKKIKNIILTHIKNKSSNIYEDINYNPFIINDNENYNKIKELNSGFKFSTFDLSQKSIPKKLLYSKINKNLKEMKDKKINKINLSKIDLHNLRVKKNHAQRINECKKLINVSIKEVMGVKNNCLNLVKELREKYSDLYKGFGIENSEDY